MPHSHTYLLVFTLLALGGPGPVHAAQGADPLEKLHTIAKSLKPCDPEAVVERKTASLGKARPNATMTFPGIGEGRRMQWMAYGMGLLTVDLIPSNGALVLGAVKVSRIRMQTATKEYEDVQGMTKCIAASAPAAAPAAAAVAVEPKDAQASTGAVGDQPADALPERPERVVIAFRADMSASALGVREQDMLVYIEVGLQKRGVKGTRSVHNFDESQPELFLVSVDATMEKPGTPGPVEYGVRMTFTQNAGRPAQATTTTWSGSRRGTVAQDIAVPVDQYGRRYPEHATAGAGQKLSTAVRKQIDAMLDQFAKAYRAAPPAAGARSE